VTATTFTETVSEYLGGGLSPLAEFGVALLGAVLLSVILLGVVGLSAVWLKRKLNARFGDRIAVNRVGPFGLFILFADSLKLLSKEVVVPEGADRLSYSLAPVLAVVAVLLSLSYLSGAGYRWRTRRPDSSSRSRLPR
jgi:NADH-quinone oxidoreductase subunit H